MINYQRIVKVIMARAKCSSDEGWTGLAQAFLSLDRDRSEGEQVQYLIRYGALMVTDEVRKKYIDSDGTLRFTPLDEEVTAEPPSASDEYAFLKAFPEGLVREFATRLADGTSTFTAGSASHWLRKFKHINKRTTVQEVLNGTRISAERLQ